MFIQQHCFCFFFFHMGVVCGSSPPNLPLGPPYPFLGLSVFSACLFGKPFTNTSISVCLILRLVSVREILSAPLSHTTTDITAPDSL